MADRDSAFGKNQIKDRTVTQLELDITNNPTDGQIFKINMPDGDFTAIDLGDIGDITTIQTNIVLNAFRIAINGSLTQFNMVDGIVDEYEDENSIDNPNSTNESYDSVNDLYSPLNTFVSNADDFSEDMAVISEWSDNDAGTGVHSQVTFDSRSAVKLDTGASTGSRASMFQNSLFTGTRNVATVAVYLETVGSNANDDDLCIQFDDGSTIMDVSFGSDGLFIFDGSIHNEVGSNLTIADTWQEWTFDIDWTAQTVDVYLEGVLQASDVDCSATGGNSGRILFRQNGATQSNQISYVDFVDVGSDFVPSGDMTLLSNSFTAETQPDNARIVLFEEDVDSVTLNTDLKAFVSRDSGQTFTTDFATDDKLDITSHGFSNDDRIMVTSSSQDLPAGLDSATVYYVINATTNDFELSLTSGGSAVDITDDGTGTHTAKQVSEITLANDGEYESGKNILTGSVDISGQPSGTSMEYKIVTGNNKDLKIHGTGLSWD